MSNRQARREQSRQSRPARQPGRSPGRQGPRAPSGGGGGSSPSDFISRPYVIGIGALIVVLAAVLVIFAVNSGGGGDEDAAAALRTAKDELPLDMADGYFLGSADAPLTLTMYEDFQCPFCLRFTAEDEPAIVEEYVKAGKVRIEYQHYAILGAESVRAAVASQCAVEQDKFWEYQNALFTLQADEGQLSSEKLNAGRFSDEKLKEFAGDLGLDTAAFATCLDSADTLATVQQQVTTAQQFGLRGTPSFLINGVPLGGTPNSLDSWRALLDEQIDAVENPSPTVDASASETPADSGTPEATATQ
jgi:protein-disulfide isomerase